MKGRWWIIGLIFLAHKHRAGNSRYEKHYKRNTIIFHFSYSHYEIVDSLVFNHLRGRVGRNNALMMNSRRRMPDC